MLTLAGSWRKLGSATFAFLSRLPNPISREITSFPTRLSISPVGRILQLHQLRLHCVHGQEEKSKKEKEKKKSIKKRTQKCVEFLLLSANGEIKRKRKKNTWKWCRLRGFVLCSALITRSVRIDWYRSECCR